MLPVFEWCLHGVYMVFHGAFPWCLSMVLSLCYHGVPWCFQSMEHHNIGSMYVFSKLGLCREIEVRDFWTLASLITCCATCLYDVVLLSSRPYPFFHSHKERFVCSSFCCTWELVLFLSLYFCFARRYRAAWYSARLQVVCNSTGRQTSWGTCEALSETSRLAQRCTQVRGNGEDNCTGS